MTYSSCMRFNCTVMNSSSDAFYVFSMGLRADHAPQNRSGRAVPPTSGREVVAFYPLPGHTEEPPEDLLKRLSRDQEILLRLALAVQSG